MEEFHLIYASCETGSSENNIWVCLKMTYTSKLQFQSEIGGRTLGFAGPYFQTHLAHIKHVERLIGWCLRLLAAERWRLAQLFLLPRTGKVTGAGDSDRVTTLV